MRARAVALVLLVLGAAAAGSAAAGSGLSATVVPLPATSLYGIWLAADPEHGHLYVSGGWETSDVYVVNVDGSIDTVLHDLPNAMGMALAPAYDRLFVSLAGSDRIAIVDTAAVPPVLERAVRVGSARPLIGSIAASGRHVWFGYGECDRFTAAVGQLLLPEAPTPGGDRPRPVRSRDRRLHDRYCPALAASPGRPDDVLVWDTGLTPAWFELYHFSRARPKLRAPLHARGGQSAHDGVRA